LLGFEEFGDLRPLDAMPRARAAALRSLELDPGLAEGHCWAGVVTFLFDWDWGAAEAAFRRAIELRPDYSLAHTWYAVFLMARGRHDEAIARSEHAAELDPLAFTIQAVLGQCLYFARRYDEALERHRATLELDPGNLRAWLWSARSYRREGRLDEASRMVEAAIERCGRVPTLLGERGVLLALAQRPGDAAAVLDEVAEIRRGRYVGAIVDAAIHLALGDQDEARRWMDRMVEERSGLVPFLGSDPGWDTTRNDPWFAALLARAGVT
jgi:serine/threonine-protein kinase